MIGSLLGTKYVLKKQWTQAIILGVISIIAAWIAPYVLIEIAKLISFGTVEYLALGGFIICTILWLVVILLALKFFLKVPIKLRDIKLQKFLIIAYLVDGLFFYALGYAGTTVAFSNGLSFILALIGL